MNIDIRPSDQEATMSRVQLALNVSDLDQAVGFYSKLFGTEPAKRRPGYANFAIAEPPLKQDGVDCCYAVQDKVWVSDPDGARWEVYTVLEDSNEFNDSKKEGAPT